jgi:hypothetical protein
MDKESIAAQLNAAYVSKYGIPPSKELPEVVYKLAVFHEAMTAQFKEPAKEIDMSQLASVGNRIRPDW